MSSPHQPPLIDQTFENTLDGLAPRPAPLFDGAVTHQHDPQLLAQIHALGLLYLQPTSPSRVLNLLTELPRLDAAAAMRVGHDAAHQFNQLIDEAARLMLHPTLRDTQRVLEGLMDALDQFGQLYERPVGWLNRLIWRDQTPQLTQTHYMKTRQTLSRLLDRMKPLLLKLGAIRQRLLELSYQNSRIQSQFDEYIAALTLYQQQHPEPAQHQVMEDGKAMRLARRLASLQVLAQSAQLQAQQLALMVEQLHQLHERMNEVQQVIYPLWQQQCMTLLSGQQHQDAMAELHHIQHQFVDRLSQSALVLASNKPDLHR